MVKVKWQYKLRIFRKVIVSFNMYGKQVVLAYKPPPSHLNNRYIHVSVFAGYTQKKKNNNYQKIICFISEFSYKGLCRVDGIVCNEILSNFQHQIPKKLPL